MDKFKNVALSLAVIAGVAGLVFGATRATWTAEGDVQGNQIGAAYMSVNIGGLPTYYDQNGNPVYGQGYPLFFEDDAHFDDNNNRWHPAEKTLGRMWPGDERVAYLEIGNSSDAEVAYTVGLDNFQNHGDGPNIDGVLNVRIEQIVDVEVAYDRPLGYPFNDIAEANNWSGRFTFAPGYDGESDPDRFWGLWTTSPWSVADKTLADFRDGVYTFGGSGLTPKNVALYEITVQLDPNAGVEYQGKVVNFDIVVTAEPAL